MSPILDFLICETDIPTVSYESTFSKRWASQRQSSIIIKYHIICNNGQFIILQPNRQFTTLASVDR